MEGAAVAQQLRREVEEDLGEGSNEPEPDIPGGGRGLITVFQEQEAQNLEPSLGRPSVPRNAAEEAYKVFVRLRDYKRLAGEAAANQRRREVLQVISQTIVNGRQMRSIMIHPHGGQLRLRNSAPMQFLQMLDQTSYTPPPPLPDFPICDGYGMIPLHRKPATPSAPLLVPAVTYHTYVDDSNDYLLREIVQLIDRPEPPQLEPTRQALSFQEILAANPIQGSEPPAPVQRRENSPSGRDLARPPPSMASGMDLLLQPRTPIGTQDQSRSSTKHHCTLAL